MPVGGILTSGEYSVESEFRFGSVGGTLVVVDSLGMIGLKFAACKILGSLRAAAPAMLPKPKPVKNDTPEKNRGFRVEFSRVSELCRVLFCTGDIIGEIVGSRGRDNSEPAVMFRNREVLKMPSMPANKL